MLSVNSVFWLLFVVLQTETLGQVVNVPRRSSQGVSFSQPSPNGYEWDQSIAINRECDDIWPFVGNYTKFLSILFVDSHAQYTRGHAFTAPSTVYFEVDNKQINVEIVISDNNGHYLSYVLLNSFDLMSTMRGEWFLDRCNVKQDASGHANTKMSPCCEIHKGSMFILDPNSGFTPKTYQQIVETELYTLAKYFDPSADKQEL